MFWNSKDDMTMLGIECDRGNMSKARNLASLVPQEVQSLELHL